MKMFVKIMLFALALLICFSGCGKETEQSKSPDTPPNQSEGNVDVPELQGNDSEDGTSAPSADESADGSVEVMDAASLFTDRDTRTDYDTTTAVSVRLEGDSISCSSAAAKIEGTTVTLTEDGCYVFSGTLEDGMVIIDMGDDDKPQIVLDGVSITSSTSAAIYVRAANKVFITLAEGTENRLANGGGFTQIDDNNIDSAIFSKSDLTINGSGSLTVDSPAGHGVVSKDDLAMTGGIYSISGGSHGLSANNSIRLSGVSVDISSGKDGIHAEHNEDSAKGFVYILDGTYNIVSDYDGVSAGSYMQIAGGSFNLSCGGGSVNGSSGGNSGNMGRPGGTGGFYESSTTSDESIKGFKAANGLVIEDGSFKVDAADDAFHSNLSITVNGGSFDVSTGDDGFHADETLTVNGGNIKVTKSYEGLEALDVLITGGEISICASDDGVNAAGGTDESGMGGNFGNDNFGSGGGRGRPGGMGGGMMSAGNGSVVISGGNIYINAYGDGIDANGSLEITGGYVVVCGPTSGDTSVLDYDTTATISGGTFIGTGASGMAQSFNKSPQGVIGVRINNQSAGEAILLTDTEGNTVLTHEAQLGFTMILLSSPDIISGESYILKVGGITETISAS